MEFERRDFLKAIGGIATLTTAGAAPALADQHGGDGGLNLEEFGLQYLQNDTYSTIKSLKRSSSA